MRERLIQYVDLLFAGTKNADDIKEEILQNTLDRFDDLIAQGKTQEAAYSLAISGIGDLSEILHDRKEVPKHATAETTSSKPEKEVSNTVAKVLRSIAIALYILCPIPLFILGNELGLCGLLGIVAIATALIVLSGKHTKVPEAPLSTKQRILMGVNAVIWISAFVLFGKISELTEAWYITWVIFPAAGCICGIIKCCFYLRENFVRSLISGIIQLVVLALLITVLFGGIYVIDTQFDGGTTITQTESTPIILSKDEIKDIRIEWVSGTITLQPHDDPNSIKIWETGAATEADAYVVKQHGDTLTIQYCATKISIGIFGQSIGSKNLTILVPQQWLCGELKIDSVSSSITVESIQANSFDLVNVSGSCEFIDCTVTEVEAETVSGKVSYTGQLQELNYSTVSADCKAVLYNTPSAIDIESVSGDLELILPANSGYRLDWDSASGDFRCDYSGNSHVYGDGGCEISVDTVSGDVTLNQTF